MILNLKVTFPPFASCGLFFPFYIFSMVESLRHEAAMYILVDIE